MHVARIVLLASMCLSALAGVIGAAAAPARAGACTLANGGFEAASFFPWVLQTNSGALATLSVDAGQAGAQSAMITIGEAGVFEWDVQLVQEGASLIPGKRYTLSFWSKAQASRSVSAVLQQIDTPYNTFSRQSFQIGASWQRHSAEFVYPLTALTASPALRINIGANGATVWFDSISLCESDTQGPPPTPQPVSASCEVRNGEFEAGSFSPWVFQTTPPASATLSAVAGARSPTEAPAVIFVSYLLYGFLRPFLSRKMKEEIEDEIEDDEESLASPGASEPPSGPTLPS